MKLAILVVGALLTIAGFLMALLDDGDNASRWWHSMLCFGIGIVMLVWLG